MEASKNDRTARQPERHTGSDDPLMADLKRTPLWNAYYQRVRQSIRIPRYYRKALNW